MNGTTGQKWIVRSNDFKQSEFIGVIRTPNKNELTMAGLKKWGLYWGLALICVPIPGLHFILVPVFLVLGVSSFVKAYGLKHMLETGGYRCPNCQAQHEFKNKYLQVDRRLRCDQCGLQLVIKCLPS